MKKKNRLLRISFLIAFLAFFGLGQNAWAQATSSGSGNWVADAATVWTATTAPTVGQNITIQTGHSITLDATTGITYGNITIEDGATLIIGGAFTLNIGGDLVVGEGTTGTFTTAGGTVVVTGTTNILAGAAMTSTGGTLTFNGAVTNAGTLNIIGTIAIFNAALTPGTLTTDDDTQLTYNHTANLTLPAAVTALNKLTISNTGSVALSANLALGNAVPVAGAELTISNSGNLNISSFNVSLLDATDAISETGSGTIVGTTGYIQTVAAGTTAGNINTSGIGVTGFNGVGTDYVVYRYPVNAFIITGLYASAHRYYRIDEGTGAAPTSMTLEIDNDELAGLTLTDLVLISATDATFGTANVHGTTGRVVSSGANRSTVAYTGLTGIAGEYYGLFANTANMTQPKTFTGALSNLWNVAGNWSPAIVPTLADSVVIPSGKTVNVNANGLCAAITVVDATAIVNSGISLTVAGNINLLGTSSLTAGDETAEVIINGGGTPSINVAEDSYLEFGDLTVTLTTSVTTSSNFTVKGILNVAAASSLIANGGTATFNPTATSVLWNNAGTLTLNDVLITAGGTSHGTPATNLTVKGNFTKAGAANFVPATPSVITFSNTDPVGKNIQLAGGTNSFFGLAVATGSKVLTSSTFSISGTATAINIQGTGSFVAQAGTITFSAAAVITKASAATLKFNNLTFSDGAGTTVASSSASDFTVAGDMTLGAAETFTASAGTVTFENNISRSLTVPAGATATFFGLKVAGNSTLVTAGSHNFTVTGAGNLTLEAGATFTQDAAGTATFAAAGTKNIVVDTTATLTLGIVAIADVAANAVQTSSSFKVVGATFGVGGTNGTFTANSPSTITFAATNTISSATSARISFFNVLIDNFAVTLTADHYIDIKGNLTINNAAGNFTSTNSTGATGYVTFNGTSLQKITGTTSNTPTFARLQVNKTTGTDTDKTLTMELPVTISSNANSDLDITAGILNMGSKTLTVGLGAVSTGGAAHYINGGTGTFVISAVPASLTLGNPLFNSTLYNLTVGAVEALSSDLVVNGNIVVNANLTIPSAMTLTLFGNLTQGAGDLNAGDATATLKLVGTGTCATLSNDLFTGVPSINFERAEVLTGALTMPLLSTLTINTSVNNVDIGTNILTLSNTTILNLVSGGIKADAGTVILGTGQTTIPANLFVGDVVNNITFANSTDYTLGSDLTINGTLTWATPADIITNENTLTFGPSATLPTFTNAAHIVGNLKRTVTSTAKEFPIGGGAATNYRPLTLQFEDAGSSQVIKVSSNLVNPTLGRGGDPSKAVNVLWTISPEGTTPSDDVKMTFGWPTALEKELSADYNECVPVKWNTASWADYRDNVTAGAVAAPRVLVMSSFAVPASSLNGEWAVFVAEGNTTIAKDTAIAVNRYKIGIANVNPNPVDEGFPFALTIQLQDQYGNPFAVPTSTGAINVAVTKITGTGTLNAPPVTIPVGQSSVIVPGFNISATDSYQLLATPSSTSMSINPGISPVINVLAAAPAEQASGITLSGATYTSVTMNFTLSSGSAVVLAKAGSAITAEEFPVDGTTYLASANFGQGSAIGEAVVVYKGTDPSSAVTINGLAPGTTYYFRAFSYAGSNGNEKYAKFSAANNPKSVSTTSQAEFNDDIVYGSNDTRLTAKPIGTNSPIKATLSSASDEDWFSFMVTSSTPNVRAQIYTLPGNYTLEVYDMDGNRIRRSTLNSRANEAAVINGLPSGTYTVRIFSQDGSYRTQLGEEYFLKVSTFGSEIYAVTP